MSERFIHFSSSGLDEVKSTSQDVKGVEPFFKPRGLWFSVEGNDDGWKSWCEGEMFRTAHLAIQTEIIFKETARIFRISSPEEIDTFTEKYVLHAGVFAQLGLRPGFVIDWAKLATEFDAIVIAPYQWQRRLSEHTMWYYSWDCASGCVWNADAISEIRQLTSVPA